MDFAGQPLNPSSIVHQPVRPGRNTRRCLSRFQPASLLSELRPELHRSIGDGFVSSVKNEHTKVDAAKKLNVPRRLLFCFVGEQAISFYTLYELSRGVNSKYLKPVAQSHFSAMKILHANAGTLTNIEVLDFLRSRGAANDPTRVIVSVAPSEFKVFDYLNQSAVCNQTRESIKDFAEKCKQYDLAKAEILNIINVRPASAVEIDPIIEHCETRLGDSVDGLIDLVAEVLPPPPTAEAPDVEAPDVPAEQETKTS